MLKARTEAYAKAMSSPSLPTDYDIEQSSFYIAEF